MARSRIWLTSLVLLGMLAFLTPQQAESRQYFDATIRFNPRSGTLWHYFTSVALFGDEIMMGARNTIGGIIWTIYDEEVTSSGSGLVGVHTRFNWYEALDISQAVDYTSPGGGVWGAPDYGELRIVPSRPLSEYGDLGNHPLLQPTAPEDYQSIGGDPGGGGEGPGGEDYLEGEQDFDITPIMESNLNYIMSESGRMLDVSGLDLIGDIIDPSRSITVRQLFETVHFVVLPDYEVHLNESWRAPMAWTIPYVGETMEIPLTFTLADIRTTYRFRMAAIDFSGILQFDVDTMDEGMLENERGEFAEYRKESNIVGDIIIQGRAYVDLDRGIIVALTDLPAIGTRFVDGERRGNEPYSNSIGLPWPLDPGFYATLNFERVDLYTPLGNVIDPRQERVYRMQEMQWFTTTVVE